eukprot:1398209-Alexandrium_andersonii.AAC.1
MFGPAHGPQRPQLSPERPASSKMRMVLFAKGLGGPHGSWPALVLGAVSGQATATLDLLPRSQRPVKLAGAVHVPNAVIQKKRSERPCRPGG